MQSNSNKFKKRNITPPPFFWGNGKRYVLFIKRMQELKNMAETKFQP